MYNGIGLRTARGSGTNGYVQKNLSYIKPSNIRQTVSRAQGADSYHSHGRLEKSTGPNVAILEHQRKRAIELKVMERRVAMEDQDFTEDEILSQLKDFRSTLVMDEANKKQQQPQASSAADSHARGREKIAENLKMKAALGIQGDYVEGESFDPEAQLRRREAGKIERQAKRDAYELRRENDLKRQKKDNSHDRHHGHPSSRDRSHSRDGQYSKRPPRRSSSRSSPHNSRRRRYDTDHHREDRHRRSRSRRSSRSRTSSRRNTRAKRPRSRRSSSSSSSSDSSSSSSSSSGSSSSSDSSDSSDSSSRSRSATTRRRRHSSPRTSSRV